MLLRFRAVANAVSNLIGPRFEFQISRSRGERKDEIQFLNFFVLILEQRLQRYSTSTKRYTPKMFLDALSWFSRPEFLEKGKDLPNLDIGHVMSVEETKKEIQDFQKLLKGVSLCVC